MQSTRTGRDPTSCWRLCRQKRTMRKSIEENERPSTYRALQFTDVKKNSPTHEKVFATKTKVQSRLRVSRNTPLGRKLGQHNLLAKSQENALALLWNLDLLWNLET